MEMKTDQLEVKVEVNAFYGDDATLPVSTLLVSQNSES